MQRELQELLYTVVKVYRRIRWHYSDYSTLLLCFAFVLVHGSTKYQNCKVRSHYQLARWWHQPVLRTG